MLALVPVLWLLVACGNPPQVIDIQPGRGATDVSSAQAVRMRFDRAMDHASVESRFHVGPAVSGSVRWLSDRELSFTHDSFAAATQYTVTLDGGYRDAQGGVNSLRHSWTFRTEGPPTVSDASPANGDRDVDPASYLTLTFSRGMDASTLPAAISLTPAVPVTIRVDPSDSRRVTLAPRSILKPQTSYRATLSTAARDSDGNHLASAVTIGFNTGDLRGLKHWVGLIAQDDTSGAGAGVWIVNESRFPRQLIGTPTTAFTWSADATRLLLRDSSGQWADTSIDGSSRSLPIQGTWASYVGTSGGYAYLSQDEVLRVLGPTGDIATVASRVSDAAVSADGERLAYVIADPGAGARASEIVAYDTSLGTRYVYQREPDAIDGVAWSPDGQSLAYRVDTVEAAHRQIRVRGLRDAGPVTVTTGAVSVPSWQSDRQHVFLSAVVDTSAGPEVKAFRVPIAGGAELNGAQGMPAGAGVQVSSLSPSADGHQIAFVSDASGRPGAWLMNADGTGLVELTGTDPALFPYSVQSVSWTPS